MSDKNSLHLMRHVCGKVFRVQVFQSHGETIALFYDREDIHGTGDEVHSCPDCDYPLEIEWVGSPWLVEPMDEEMARYTSVYKMCSNCWGHKFELIKAHDIEGNEIGVRVICETCQEETIGYVSDQWVHERRAAEYISYRHDISDICNALGMEKPKFQTESETLRELGF